MTVNDPSLLLKAENICKSFPNREVLKDVSFQIHQAQIISLIGPNGAGKSTLLKILLALIPADSGFIYRKPDLRISYLAQKSEINKLVPLTVKRLLKLNASAAGTDKEKQRQILELTGIRELYDNDFSSLSGGQAQRVLLARCLLRNPELLILDEPAASLDVAGKENFYHLLSVIRDTYKTAILIVSHDLHLVMKKADEVLCLNTHICCKGKPHEIPNTPDYQAIFPASEYSDLGFYVHHHNHCHNMAGEIAPLDDKEDTEQKPSAHYQGKGQQ